MEVVDWDKDHADLKWTRPENDGGAPITGYIIEFKEKFGKDWEKGKEITGDITQATIDGLKEGTQYEFRIRAVNKAGPGEPSDATKPIIAKCRFGKTSLTHRNSQINFTKFSIVVKPYLIGDDLINIVVKKGQVIKYDIKYGGEPEPEVTWQIDGKDIKEDEDRITIDKYEKNTVLTIRKTVRADSGKYKLILTNSSGTCEKMADVVVLGKPSSPMGPLEAVEVRADHVTVKWKKPDDFGGADLTGYVLEKMDLDTGRWVAAGEVGPNENSFKVEGLTPKKKYKFRVKAVNKEGESEPLETEEAILAKNPYGKYMSHFYNRYFRRIKITDKIFPDLDPPGKPGKPEIIDYDNQSVNLKWTKPENDGGRPITNYIIEMKDKLAAEWKEVGKTDGPKTEFKVEELKEKNVYQFRIRAANKAGIGDASEPTDNHLCKHKNRKSTFFANFIIQYIWKQGVNAKFSFAPCHSETSHRSGNDQKRHHQSRQDPQMGRGRQRRTSPGNVVDLEGRNRFKNNGTD